MELRGHGTSVVWHTQSVWSVLTMVVCSTASGTHKSVPWVACWAFQSCCRLKVLKQGSELLHRWQGLQPIPNMACPAVLRLAALLLALCALTDARQEARV